MRRIILVFGFTFILVCSMVVYHGEAKELHLYISAPTSVIEGEIFQVNVTDDHEDPVENVTVEFLNQHYLTDENGTVMLGAPLVDQTELYTLSAGKTGYIGHVIGITIEDNPPVSHQLIIEAPPSVREGELFLITITLDSPDHTPVDNVTITFNTNIYKTGEVGTVELPAPFVEENTNYLLTATKDGYLDSEVWISITDVPQPNILISSPATITEGEKFLIIVTANEQPLSNATIIFADNIYSTNLSGQTLLTAPLVAKDKIYSILAQKEGYQQGSQSIIILNSEDNIEQVFAGVDGVCDALDNFESRFVLNAFAVKHRIPLFHGAIWGLQGEVTTVVPGESACYRCLYSEAMPGELFPVAGVTPGVIAVIQATEAIKYFTNVGELLKDQLLIYEGDYMTFTKVKLKRNPDCPVCGDL